MADFPQTKKLWTFFFSSLGCLPLSIPAISPFCGYCHCSLLSRSFSHPAITSSSPFPVAQLPKLAITDGKWRDMVRIIVGKYSSSSAPRLSLRCNVTYYPFARVVSKEQCLIYVRTLQDTLDISYGMSSWRGGYDYPDRAETLSVCS